MTGMIDANTKDNECGLLPYPIILAANKGDPEAMNPIIRFFVVRRFKDVQFELQ